MAKGPTTTSSSTTMLNPATQAALDDYMRRSAESHGSFQKLAMPGGPLGDALGFASKTGLEGVEDYFNPYQDEVIGSTRDDFAHQRGVVGRSADDDVVKSGAFGGNRAGVYRAVAESGVNRDEASTIARLRAGGWQDAVAQLLGERGRIGNLYQQNVGNADAALGRMGYGLGFGNRTTMGSTTEQQGLGDQINQWIALGLSGAEIYDRIRKGGGNTPRGPADVPGQPFTPIGGYGRGY